MQKEKVLIEWIFKIHKMSGLLKGKIKQITKNAKIFVAHAFFCHACDHNNITDKIHIKNVLLILRINHTRFHLKKFPW